MVPDGTMGATPEPAARPIPGTDFAVYRGDGTPASISDIVAAAGQVEAVLLGEEHDDDIGHQLQLEIFRQIVVGYGDIGLMAEGSPSQDGSRPPIATAGSRPLVLSLEMFERDVQYIVDEYLKDLISETHFRASARPWDNYEEHYRPLVEFAKEHGLPVVAANAPRRYVNRASRLGRESLEALPESAKAFLPPLPYPEASAAYRAEWDALMGDAGMHMSGDPLDGQTLWDAGMGQSIAQALDAREDALLVHLAGGFHVEFGTGTPEALEYYRPGTRTLIVAVRKQEVLDTFPAEMRGAGDWVILTRAPADGSN